MKNDLRLALCRWAAEDEGGRKRQANVVLNWLENYWAKGCAEGVRRDYFSSTACIDSGRQIQFWCEYLARRKKEKRHSPVHVKHFPADCFLPSLHPLRAAIQSVASRGKMKRKLVWRNLSRNFAPLKALNLIFHVYRCRVSKLLSLHSESVHILRPRRSPTAGTGKIEK